MQFPNDGFMKSANGKFCSTIPPTEAEYQGLKMEVMGLASVVQYTPGPDEVAISIHSDMYRYEKPDLIAQGFVDVLPLEFDDTEFAEMGNPNAKPYTEQMAKKVAEFVLKHKDKKKIVIHCFAGMSRSRSMAAGIVHGLNRFHGIELPYRWTVKSRGVAYKTQVAFQPETNELPDKVYERHR